MLLADAAPRPDPVRVPPGDYVGSTTNDPLSGIRLGVREARLGPAPIEANCGNQLQNAQLSDQRRDQRDALGITWPYGLAANLLLGLLFTLLAVRRLRAPARTLPRGTRVA